MAMQKKRILFICTHNSARSQMAEGLVNALWGETHEAFSAGTLPSLINPLAIEVMRGIGIDISTHRSKGLDEFMDKEFDLVITVCDRANETCPIFHGGKKRIHKGFEDPAAVMGSPQKQKEAFRKIRDQIKDWLENELIPLYS